MKADSGRIRLSASDLSDHLACNYLTVLDFGVATRTITAPTWHSPDAWILQQLGLAHENAYIEHLKSQRLSIANLREIGSEKDASAQTFMAMQEGVDVVVQGVITTGRWLGRADVLRKVSCPSKLGAWSYEAYDCKLALETKAATILQLSLYSELLAEVQGRLPEFMYVVPPNEEFAAEQYRVLDFAAYHRYVKRHLENAVDNRAGGFPSYPEPTEHCAVCRWWEQCDTQRRKDDHLSLVAGISTLQRKQLEEWQVTTLGGLALLPLPLQHRPSRGSKNGYIRVREQARVQLTARQENKPVFEVFPLNPEHGFYDLPEPSPGDVFFDFEADPFAGPGGREYLFGFAADAGAHSPAYECHWAMTQEEEKRAFEWFVDVTMARWAQYPAMHVYHFTAYEPAALARLMGRYATREDEIDRMLRAHLFVDLHTISKRAIRASVEEYSLKTLEVFHEFERKLPLPQARYALRRVQHALELGEIAPIEDSVRNAVTEYNADDCLSTLSLRNWLERQRLLCEQAGNAIPRPATSDAGAFLKDVGKALKDVSVGVYQKVRDWWTQPLDLAPEIDRNPGTAAWASPAPTYYEQVPPQMWSAPQAGRTEAQAFDQANVVGRSRGGEMPRNAGPQRKAERIATNAETRASEQNAPRGRDSAQDESRSQAQPALIVRNNFQFADFTGARFESIHVQDNDFRHAVLANAQFPAELHASNKIERSAAPGKQPTSSEIRETTEPLRQPKTEAERQQDRADLAQTIKRDIEKRERGLQQGDSAMYRETDALHLAKEMLRQVEAGPDRIDLTTAYKAVDGATAEERHVRAYNSVNPLIAEAYAKGIAVNRGSATLERAQAVSDEAARLHEDVNATPNGQDRKDLIAETKSLAAEGVSLRTDGEAKESELRADLDREGITPLITMEQDRFDALLAVGVFDFGKSPEWRKEMDQKITERFTALSTDPSINGQDRRTLWQEAAKQVQQGELLIPQPTREPAQERSLEMANPSQVLAHKQEMRRGVAVAR